MHHVDFDVPIYAARVYVILLDEGLDDCDISIQSVDGLDFGKVAADTAAQVCKVHGVHSTFYFAAHKNHCTYNNIGHEVYHLAHWILRDKDIRYSHPKEEVYAYFYGFLLEKVIKSLLSLHLNLPFEQQHHDSRNIGMAEPGPSDTAVLQRSNDAGQEAEAREHSGSDQDSREE
jgi:hypothetical protein